MTDVATSFGLGSVHFRRCTVEVLPVHFTPYFIIVKGIFFCIGLICSAKVCVRLF